MNWYKKIIAGRDNSNPWIGLFDSPSDDPYKKKNYGPGTGRGFNLMHPLQDAGVIEGYPGDYTKKYNPGQFSETDNGAIMSDRPTDFDGEDTNNNDMKRPFEGDNAFYSEDSPLSVSQQIMQQRYDNVKGVHNMNTNVPDIYSKIRGIYQGQH